MIRRLAVLACVAAAPAAAQLLFSVVGSSAESGIDTQVQLAEVAAGDTLETLLRVRNHGNSTAPLTLLSIAGAAFSLANLPALPATLLPGAYADFTLRFQPPAAGSYSAILRADGVSVFVLARAVPVLTIFLEENGSRRQLEPSATIAFGAVERGTQAVRRLLAVNQTAQPLAAALSIAGAAFHLPPSVATVAVDPQSSTTLEIAFRPAQAGPQHGELRIDQRRFTLRGTTVEPPLPKPLITLDLAGRTPRSGLQPLAAVRFDPPPRTSGTGTLSIRLQPSVPAQDDPAVLFLSTGSRSIEFSAIEAEPNAQFGAVIAVPFQTGTTAGTLILTAELGDHVESTTMEVPPQPVAIDTVQMARTAAGVEVQINGFDNTRSISLASFHFLQKDGSVIAPGALQQDVTAAFQDYFARSASGGAFQMKAAFPVTGTASLIDAVRVVLTNSAGQASWPALP